MGLQLHTSVSVCHKNARLGWPALAVGQLILLLIATSAAAHSSSHRTYPDPRRAPAPSAPNGYGLVDMAGNAWEWCVDLYDAGHYAERIRAEAIIANPRGPAAARDPRNPFSADSRVRRGGSFLCNDSYCASDRPSARMGCASDTGMSHIGFRCVTDQPAPAQSHHAHTD